MHPVRAMKLRLYPRFMHLSNQAHVKAITKCMVSMIMGEFMRFPAIVRYNYLASNGWTRISKAPYSCLTNREERLIILWAPPKPRLGIMKQSDAMESQIKYDLWNKHGKVNPREYLPTDYRGLVSREQ